MSFFDLIHIKSRLMDIRLSKEMKAVLLDTMSSYDSPKRSVSILHNWIVNWGDVKSWPKSKVVKDTLRLYEHLDSVHGTNEFVKSFVKEMNKVMKWTGVSMSFPDGHSAKWSHTIIHDDEVIE
jgi:hypothetical protein|tara:strand:- start:914 stop:1282 length:369 start_codon:yes stop_codon:yes gene_type:complete